MEMREGRSSVATCELSAANVPACWNAIAIRFCNRCPRGLATAFRPWQHADLCAAPPQTALPIATGVKKAGSPCGVVAASNHHMNCSDPKDWKIGWLSVPRPHVQPYSYGEH
jgi:hypothetical protein